MRKALISLLILAGITAPFVVGAQYLTPDQIRVQIQALMQQVQYLQQQLNSSSQGYGGYGYNYSGYGSCYVFNANLGVGSSGPDVAALQSILGSQGFTISYSETSQSFYGASTAAAVSQFQMNHYSEILMPYGLASGTGYVGVSTRAKLNQISQANCSGQNYYGYNYSPYNYSYNSTYNCLQVYPYNCNNQYPYSGNLTVTSPSANQTYQQGANVYVAWSSNYYNYSYSTQNFAVELWNNGGFVTRAYAGNSSSYNFTLPNNLSYGSGYYFKVYDQNNQSVSGTSQNFTVGYGVSGGGISVLGPNGGEQVRINSSYPIQFMISAGQNAYRARIELWQNGYILGVITDGLPIFMNQTQTYTWNGGSYNDVSSGMSRTAPPGYGYKIRVLAYDSSNNLMASDDSNSPFSLIYN